MKRIKNETLDHQLNYSNHLLEYFNEMPDRIKQIFLLDNDFFMWSGFNFGGCKSPIEQIFISAFDVYQTNFYEDFVYLDSQTEIKANGKTYYADFTFEPEPQFDDFYHRGKKKLIIECDGYDFHQKTKEQVKRDNERAYDLKMAGYDIIRFSGSEIYNTPFKCVEKTLNYIRKMIEEE